MTRTVEIKNMSKRFGPTVALDNVSFEAHGGEILGLIGENGSGKSTATSIFAGMQRCDSGEMLFEGKAWSPASMTDALNKGVGMIVQESGTVAGISVAENIFLGETKDFRKGLFIDRKRMIEEAQKALDGIGADHIRADAVTGTLDFQDRKLTEIAKVMVKAPRVLIVDETTTALSQKGRDIIYTIMNRMKEEGKTVIFISHDLDEIMEKCDRLTVLRDGKIIRTFENEGLCLGDQLKDLSFELHAGEILGVGGLSHCGMHTLGKVLFGAEKAEKGSFTVKGKAVRNEAEAMRLGIGYVAKDRDTESLCTEASIKDNIAVAGLDRFAVKNFLILPGKEKQYVNEQVQALSIKCRNADQYVSALSGGNKQKVAFGKWTGRRSEILILDCPTRGVDIGVKQAMYRLMDRIRKEGRSVLLISEELAELIGMSDRLLIMKDGRLEKEFKRDPELTEADVIRCMI